MLNRDMIVGNASRDGARAASLGDIKNDICSGVKAELSASGIPVPNAASPTNCAVQASSPTTITITCKKPDGTACSTQLRHRRDLGLHRNCRGEVQPHPDHSVHQWLAGQLRTPGTEHADEGRVSMKRYLTLRTQARRARGGCRHRRPAVGRAPDVRCVRRRHRHADQQEAPAQRHPRRSRASRRVQPARKLEHRQGRRPRLRSRPRPQRDRGADAQRRLLVRRRVQARLQRACVSTPPRCPSTCYPGPANYTPGVNYKTTGRKISCGPVLCAIPQLRGASTEHRNAQDRVQHDPGLPGTNRRLRLRTGRWNPAGIDRQHHLGGLQGLLRHDCAQPDGRCDRCRPHEQHGPDRCRQAARRHQGHAAVDDPEPAVRRSGDDRSQWPDHHRSGRRPRPATRAEPWLDLREQLRAGHGSVDADRVLRRLRQSGSGDAEDQRARWSRAWSCMRDRVPGLPTRDGTCLAAHR